MKGICLAGGLGTRMRPLTDIENKHHLPVGAKRMVEYPLNTLSSAGIKDIILVTGGRHPGVFLDLLGNGHSRNINRLYYTYQEGNGGIADALKLAEPFVDTNEPSVIILGDNYFEDGIQEQYDYWVNECKSRGCLILLKQVSDPERFGVAEIYESGSIASIEEKPAQPKTDLAITGCYMMDSQVWNWISSLQPSERGELEITDILNKYLAIGQLYWHFYKGYWSDMGQFESWLEVTSRVLRTL